MADAPAKPRSTSKRDPSYNYCFFTEKYFLSQVKVLSTVSFPVILGNMAFPKSELLLRSRIIYALAHKHPIAGLGPLYKGGNGHFTGDLYINQISRFYIIN